MHGPAAYGPCSPNQRLIRDVVRQGPLVGDSRSARGGAGADRCAPPPHTAVAKRNLDVQTKMTDTRLPLDPVAEDERTVYVEVNTSDKPDFDTPQIRDAVAARGYRVVSDPRQARFVLQANVLQAGRMSETAAEQAQRRVRQLAVRRGRRGCRGLRARPGRDRGQRHAGCRGRRLIGTAISSVADAYVQDTTYTIVTDLQISERAPRGVVVSQSEQANLAQGSSGTVTQSSSTTTDRKRYRTRIVSTAEKVIWTGRRPRRIWSPACRGASPASSNLSSGSASWAAQRCDSARLTAV